MSQNVYLLGYLGIPTFAQKKRKVDGVHAALDRSNAFLADIRIKPWSVAPCWRAASLAQEFGDRYIGIPELGNRNYRGDLGDGFHIADMDGGIRRLMQEAERRGQAPMLLCACGDVENCHRLFVAKELHRRGLVADIIEVHWRAIK